MNAELRTRLSAMAKAKDMPSIGRPVEEIIRTTELVKGFESQRLRTFCTSECMEPARDLDSYGRLLFSGDLMMVRADYLGQVSTGELVLGSMEASRLSVSKHLHGLHWGPTKVPLYNLLGLFMIIMPGLRKGYLDIARFLINNANVPVTGVDLSGTTALSHSFSTKPGLDFEYAQMLYDAGGDVNNRNRYGGTVGHEIIQVYQFQNKKVVEEAKTAFNWFLAHGGNIDIADTDGCSVRSTLVKMKPLLVEFVKLAEKEDRRRAVRGDACCTTCGREDKKLLICGRCKKARYCQPPGRICQKVDWPRHKKECKA